MNRRFAPGRALAGPVRPASGPRRGRYRAQAKSTLASLAAFGNPAGAEAFRALSGAAPRFCACGVTERSEVTPQNTKNFQFLVSCGRGPACGRAPRKVTALLVDARPFGAAPTPAGRRLYARGPAGRCAAAALRAPSSVKGVILTPLRPPLAMASKLANGP